MKIRARLLVPMTLMIVGIVACATRPIVGRTHPHLPAYYSFDQGPFTYLHTYRRGRVGPFSVGQSKDDAIRALASQESRFILSMEMSPEESAQFYFTDNVGVSRPMRAILERSDEWSIHFRAPDNQRVFYGVAFDEGRVRTITAGSALLAGL